MARRPSVQAQIVDPHREHEPCVSSNTTACNGGGNNVPRNVTRWKQVWGEAWMCRSGVFVAGASCVLCGCAVSMIQSSKSAIRGELLLVTFDSAKAGCTSQLGALQPQRPPIVGRVVSQQLRSAESMSTNPRVFFQISCANPIARLLRRRSSPVACAAASGRVMLAELSEL